MKKIVIAVCFLFLMVQPLAFADEIIDSQGNIIPCKVETVGEDYVEYHKDGNLYAFFRTYDTPVFNDYVDVRTKLFKKEEFERISGKVLVRDLWGVTMLTEQGRMEIPFYRVKFIGIYKP